MSPTPAALVDVRPTEGRPWVIQRRIYGVETSLYAVCHSGRLTAFAAYASDWRLPGGAAYAFHPAPQETAQALRPIADRLAAEVGTGQIACDAIVDASGQPWLIECNPRATSGVHLFGAGAAFGRALAGEGEARPDDLARHIGPALWRYGLPHARRTDRVEAWQRQRRTGEDALTRPGDRGPLAGALVDTLGFGLRALGRRQSLTAAMTADIEWNGEPLDPARWSRS